MIKQGHKCLLWAQLSVLTLALTAGMSYSISYYRKFLRAPAWALKNFIPQIVTAYPFVVAAL